MSTQAEIQTEIIPLLNVLSAMQITYNGTSGGSTIDLTSSYTTVGTSSSGGVTTYKLSVSSTYSGSSSTSTAWVDSNGNVIAVEEGGYNITGSMAQSIFIGFMSPFLAESSYSAQLSYYTGMGFTSTGTSTVTLGPTTMTVTGYTASTLPYTIDECGTSVTISAFSLQIGPVPGTTFNVVTHIHIASTSGGTSSDVTVRVTSLTKA